MTVTSVEAKTCNSYSRWERAADDSPNMIQAVAEQLAANDIAPFFQKRDLTTGLSILTAHQFRDLTQDASGVQFNVSKLAADFIADTNRTPLQPVIAPIKRVDLIESYRSRRKKYTKIALVLDSPVISCEVSAINALIGREQQQREAHVSLLSIKEPQSRSERRRVLKVLSDVVPETVCLQPVKQKGVNGDGITRWGSLRTLEHQYYLGQALRNPSRDSMHRYLMTLLTDVSEVVGKSRA